MSDMSMKVLSQVVENADLPENEIMSAVCAAFPRESYSLIAGYIYQLRDKEYLTILDSDNRIVAIKINPSAYVALREDDDADEHTTQNFNIGAIHGQVAMGNKGGSYNMSLSKAIARDMSDGLKNVLTISEKRITDELEREQLKRLVTRIVESLEKQEPPPQGLIEKLDSFLQKHSWISAPLAAAFLNALSKLFSY